MRPSWILLALCAPLASSSGESLAAPAAERKKTARAKRPPPIRIEYASYGVGLSADILVHPGETCSSVDPCILGGGGGLTLRGGYRWAGPWYLGGAYQVSRTDSSNLYRLPTLQQLRLESRYMLELGYRTVPFAAVGAGAIAYGNELRAETAGGTVFVGLGAEVQLSRLAVLGACARYQPMLFAAFVDTAGYDRPLGLAHYGTLELQLEIRTEARAR